MFFFYSLLEKESLQKKAKLLYVYLSTGECSRINLPLVDDPSCMFDVNWLAPKLMFSVLYISGH